MLEKLKISKKVLKEMDFGIIILSILIVIFGSINIYSATVKKFGINYFRLQLIWLVLGLFTVYVILLIDYTVISKYAGVIYGAAVMLLLYNDFTQKAVNGASSWIKLGNRAIQPGEFAKLAILIILAKKIDDMEGNVNKPKNFFTLLLYAAIPMFLIVIQPDMGMTMLCFFIVLGIFFVSGLNLRVIFGGLISIVLFILLVWNSPLMQVYWKKRLTIFLDPQADELGAGLQLIQSMTGIGSGNILGAGAKFGAQSGSGFVSQFVPEASTDFIFAVIAEKWGFIGGVVLLILYSLLLYKFLVTARKSKDIFGSVVCVGVFSSFLFSIVQNMGMTIGIMPISGITLPLVSYGGSSILTSFIAIGLVLNVGMRRKKINF